MVTLNFCMPYSSHIHAKKTSGAIQSHRSKSLHALSSRTHNNFEYKLPLSHLTSLTSPVTLSIDLFFYSSTRRARPYTIHIQNAFIILAQASEILQLYVFYSRELFWDHLLRSYTHCAVLSFSIRWEVNRRNEMNKNKQHQREEAENDGKKWEVNARIHTQLVYGTGDGNKLISFRQPKKREKYPRQECWKLSSRNEESIYKKTLATLLTLASLLLVLRYTYFVFLLLSLSATKWWRTKLNSQTCSYPYHDSGIAILYFYYFRLFALPFFSLYSSSFFRVSWSCRESRYSISLMTIISQMW